MSGEHNRDEINGDATPFTPPAYPSVANGSAPGSPAVAIPQAGLSGGGGGGAVNSSLIKAVNDVMYSDIGVNTLLNRLKQSIASARDFAAFLKKRSGLEEEQAKGLKRLAQTQLENVRKGEVRGGTFAVQLSQALQVHERMGENGMQFALSLHQMHEDLEALSANMERGRKQWKHEGLDAEKKASDAEQAMQKAKARYDSLAEDYDRAKTGDTKGSRRIGLKGPKSAEQYESDLQRKTEAADSEYKDKVRLAQQQRQVLISSDRPKAVKSLQELIHECDSALTLQLQKFATFNEKLLLGNGLAVSPLRSDDGPRAPKSLRELVMEIDNDTDLNNYLAGHSGKIPARASEIKYEQHPSLAPKTQLPKAPMTMQPSSAPAMQAPLTVNTQSSQPNSVNSRYGTQTQSPAQPPYSSQPASGGYPERFQQPALIDNQTPSYQTHQPPLHSQQPPQLREPYSAPPYSTSSVERMDNGFGQKGGGLNQHHQQTGSIPVISPAAIPAPAPAPAPGPQIAPAHNFSPTGGKGRVFGVSLDDLFARDQSAVPIIVIQCIQSIDMFGLETEGIYRHNGTHSHVNRLREAFDNLPPNSPQLDFRNPSNFYHDVNAVASLLKQFFRELPDPLFTKAGYGAFIEAAQMDQEQERRDGLHQAINDLPDPNYATLRALVLHLYRVMQNESKTRMTAENLAVCLAPTLMGHQAGGTLPDPRGQARAISTILANAAAIFDDD